MGRAEEAVETLEDAQSLYRSMLLPGINFTTLNWLRSAMAALKVFIDALVQTGQSCHIHNAMRIHADVEETEAILAGYWEGVLEETRRELREQQRAGGLGEAGAAGEEGGEAKKKSKAAKRKQQKRKAQQHKRGAEVAEAAAAAAVEGGVVGGVAGGQQEQGQEAQQAQQQEEGKENDEEQEGDVKDNEQAVTAAAAGMAAMGLEETEDQQEEEEEDECSVCLNAIESNGAVNPAGPPLVCGHRYHAFCFAFLGGAVYDQVHRADVSLLPVAFAGDGEYLRKR